jgi:hypothetical protein
MNSIEKLRIKNLEFKKSCYLGQEPENPSYSIDKWYKNEYYKQEKKYIKEGEFYKYPDPEICLTIHKNCFKNKECCYSIAHFVWDEHEECYTFEFVGDRPLDLTDTERVVFWRLIEHGFNVLNRGEQD